MSNQKQKLKMEFFETVDYFMVHLCFVWNCISIQNDQIYVISRVHDDVSGQAINMLEIEWPTPINRLIRARYPYQSDRVRVRSLVAPNGLHIGSVA